MPRGAVIAFSHGGGFMPLLGHPELAQMTKFIRKRVPEILRFNNPDRGYNYGVFIPLLLAHSAVNPVEGGRPRPP
ncbi:hypothetical protein GGTG_13110 [Gaeumannomyces tritici R3-111a-1]|uniref:Uncharacterized protein n=1 Tax=Gaeumannomyces tritici (strain R3-111a-1) TaxID=644352 RepID=J3PHX9_GAET3|nr:hypothetical protein GGTG_13110 [Gaeumannomyces tritici R3-111a-1]EJT69491.1 hypothetical protein GGTG_13110 [Gaeumannomyces tritici R3-111a-1]